MKKFFFAGLLLTTTVLLTACPPTDTKPVVEAKPNPKPTPGNTVKNPSGITLELNSLFYKDGDAITFVLDFHSVKLPNEVRGVVLSAPDSKDVEYVELKPLGGSRYGSSRPIVVKTKQGAIKSPDDLLSLVPNERFYALYLIDKKQASLAGVEENIVADFGTMERTTPGEATARVEPQLAASADETIVLPGGKAVGTLLRKDDLPVQIATEELIFYPKDAAQLEAFLQRSKGIVIGKQAPANDPSVRTAYLVKVDPSRGDVQHLSQLRELMGEKGEVVASKEQALGIFALAMQYQMDGFAVGVNPRLELHGKPQVTEESGLTHTMQMIAAKNTEGPCIPGVASHPCVENVPALWSYLALWDKDRNAVNTAVLDSGFAPSADFLRNGADAVECRITVGGVQECGPGAAQGPPLVGNGLFGARSWHGTGVMTTIGGRLNNGLAAGVAGQVAQPMMYKYDVGSYAFEFGTGIRKAVDDGASCINISAGYPCNILTNIGPDWDICSVSGRAGICGVVTAGVAVAVVTTCAATGWIPFFGPIACGLASGGGTSVIAACIRTLDFGDLKGPMQAGVNYAIANGVPVIASAGNRVGNIPDILRNYLNVADVNLDRWNVIPASLPGVIAVGAVDGTLDNQEFSGPRVDIWAPMGSRYYSPSSVDDQNSGLVASTLGGTSGAAPYVTGVIAAMQAVNPSLNPRTAGLSASAKAGIVARIRGLLTGSAFTNADLAAMTYSNQPVLRRNLINPLGAVQAAGVGIVPNTAAAGYDQSLNFSEVNTPDDTPSEAQTIAPGQIKTGTVVTLNTIASESQRDQDWFQISTPNSPVGLYESKVSVDLIGELGLTFPVEPDAAYNEDPPQGSKRIFKVAGLNRTGVDAPRNVKFALGSNAAWNDYVYKVSATAPVYVEPVLSISDPTNIPTDGYCAGESVTFTARADYTNYPTIDVPSDLVSWYWLRPNQGESPVLAVSNTSFFSQLDQVGEYQLYVVRSGEIPDTARGPDLRVRVKDCTVLPERLVISYPESTSGYDYNQFAIIPLTVTRVNSPAPPEYVRFVWTGTAYRGNQNNQVGPETEIYRGTTNFEGHSFRWNPDEKMIWGFTSGFCEQSLPVYFVKLRVTAILPSGEVAPGIVPGEKFIRISCEPG